MPTPDVAKALEALNVQYPELATWISACWISPSQASYGPLLGVGAIGAPPIAAGVQPSKSPVFDSGTAQDTCDAPGRW